MLIWGGREANCFFGGDWTGQIALNWLGKLTFWRNVAQLQACVSAMGFDGRTTQTVSFAVAIALAIVIAVVLLFLLNRLEMSDHRRDSLANALVFVIGVPVCVGAAYYRAGGMF
ncbi:hypothetical protein [Bradyrhizobium sp. LMTR 3]|uniref:hypothetical protein n=1 Tax=Bradyrhizobium sp. LMTR 3 TaxID=189873 RepID=UPI0011466BE1|nr:hypothetical protein [Bradyrhizobium sp. LMTR 3]